MKDGTAYARRLTKAIERLRKATAGPTIGEPDDPIRRLAIGVLGAACQEAVAQEAVDRICATMVDWNEVRVSTPNEIHQAAGKRLPDGLARCKQLAAALQVIYGRENIMSLDRLKGMPRREAKHYLEQIDGVDAYAVASVLLWSLGAHAIPVDDPLLAALRDADLVHPDASREQVQAFLERHVSAAMSKEFCLRAQMVSSGKIKFDLDGNRGSTKRPAKRAVSAAKASAERGSTVKTKAPTRRSTTSAGKRESGQNRAK